MLGDVCVDRRGGCVRLSKEPMSVFESINLKGVDSFAWGKHTLMQTHTLPMEEWRKELRIIAGSFRFSRSHESQKQ